MGAALCRSCNHPDRTAIDAALLAGGSLSELARSYGMGISSVKRHRDRHLGPQVAAANEQRQAERVAEVGTVLERLHVLAAEGERYALAMLRANAPGAASALREAVAATTHVGRLRGELVDHTEQQAGGVVLSLIAGLREQAAAEDRALSS